MSSPKSFVATAELCEDELKVHITDGILENASVCKIEEIY